jgi:hypothetical protein
MTGFTPGALQAVAEAFAANPEAGRDADCLHALDGNNGISLN